MCERVLNDPGSIIQVFLCVAKGGKCIEMSSKRQDYRGGGGGLVNEKVPLSAAKDLRLCAWCFGNHVQGQGKGKLFILEVRF